MFPALLLKQTSVEELQKGVHQALEQADKCVPYLVSDPGPLLEPILLAARRTLERARCSPLHAILRNDEQGSPCLELRSQQPISSAVREVISCELSGGHFQQATDLDELWEAIYAQVLAISEVIKDDWKTSYTSGPEHSYRFDPLPRAVLSNVFSRLDIGDFIQAASTCEHWLSVALDSTNSALRAYAFFLHTKECDVIEAVDLFTHEPMVLYASILPERALNKPRIRLLRPSSGVFLRAVDALPAVEPLFVRVYDATPGRMHFTVCTKAGCFRDFINIEWDVWLYVERFADARKMLGSRVSRVDVPSGSDLSLLKSLFPSATLLEMPVQDGPPTIDRAAVQTGPDAGTFPARLLWPRSADGSECEPGIFESDVFTAW